MKKLFAILIAKTLRFVGKLVHKGSSLPGKLALKICPDILSRLSLPSNIIAVTGSNGKTSTVGMIAQILEENGFSVAYNKEGSNQIEGVTTLILDDCDLSGKMRSDVLLLESDERYARHTFKFFHPTYYVITNLFRDQMTRNAHPEWIYDIISQSIYPDSTLLLNGDDPLVSLFGKDRKNCLYFSMDRASFSSQTVDSVYDDGAYCPSCKHKMIYEYRHFNHIGNYHCPYCGYDHPKADYRISQIDLKEGFLVFDSQYRVDLAFKSLYNAYNLLAAYSVGRILGIKGDQIASSLNRYIIKNGRVQEFTLGNTEGTLLTSKHENSISYDQSLRYISSLEEDVTVLIIVDAISRKYFTSETSWLWDIDFDLLKAENISKIILAGQYVYDLEERFSFTEIEKDKLLSFAQIPDALTYLKENCRNRLYVVTCFSDQHKVLNVVEVKR